MGNLFTTIFYQPLFNLLVFIYNLIPDIGAAIFIITVIIKLLLWPLSHKSLKSQKALQEIQPKMEELKEKYKDNKEKLGQEMMLLYRAEKVNPFSSCLPLLLQFPFIIAVFQVFRNGLTSDNFDLLYPFVSNPGSINPIMLGFLNLSEPQIFLGVLAGVAQFFQSRLLIAKSKKSESDNVVKIKKEPGMTDIMNKQMMYFMPILTIFISASLPGGLALYWFLITLLGVLDQYLVNRSLNKKRNLQIEVLDNK
ncbi:MAG: YidC/Oxa1 family membrane protein insertase [Patescibacteria group bacterium]|nr:YidC/Oxa1 family membrane protein insertase [Patescibacteria group bacterium]MDD4304660.1 YidC/Oxa1 family membrane protein insertase [Patescibacteria group bacterium]MDD4695699.1 YidC/Oxa1 family membrane protein insertase [Patescibacteria group bacterium]